MISTNKIVRFFLKKNNNSKFKTEMTKESRNQNKETDLQKKKNRTKHGNRRRT